MKYGGWGMRLENSLFYLFRTDNNFLWPHGITYCTCLRLLFIVDYSGDNNCKYWVPAGANVLLTYCNNDPEIWGLAINPSRIWVQSP